MYIDVTKCSRILFTGLGVMKYVKCRPRELLEFCICAYGWAETMEQRLNIQNFLEVQ